MGDLDASDDEDAVLLENPAYENFMHKSLKVRHFSYAPCALISMPSSLMGRCQRRTCCKQAQLMDTCAVDHHRSCQEHFLSAFAELAQKRTLSNSFVAYTHHYHV